MNVIFWRKCSEIAVFTKYFAKKYITLCFRAFRRENEKSFFKAVLRQIRLDQIRLGQIRLDQIRLDQIRLDQIRLDQIRLDKIRLDKIGLDLNRGKLIQTFISNFQSCNLEIANN